MRSHEQIDREKAAYVRAANKALVGLSEGGYRFWSYSVSHCVFDLLVGDPTAKQGNVVISLAACDYISGPVDWLKPHQLEVIFDCDRTKRDAWEFTLQDKSAGFRAVAGVFEWRKDFDLLKRNAYYRINFDADESKTNAV